MEFLNEIELDDDIKKFLAEKLQAELDARINEQTSGLKAKNDELLAEKKRVQQEREEAKQQAALEAEKNARSENDYKQLFESQKEESNALRAKIEEMNSNIVRQKINSEAFKVASTLTKDAKKAQLLQEKISQRLTLVDDELRVTDASGQLTVSNLGELAEAVKSEYSFLVDGSQANGGGAARAQGGASARQTEISRSEFEGLSHAQRKQFFSEGGKLFND
jgi:hypothetical protein